MVVICLPAAALTGIEHERIATPSIWTVQAPHWRDAAAIFGAGQAERVPQHPQQGRVGLDLDVVGLAVDG